jgi:hypothetical protein
VAYLLDANVFIEAKNRYYGFEFCPAFWDWLDERNGARSVYSIERVGEELGAIEDEISSWAAERHQSFFLRPDAQTLPALARVSAWVTGQTYEASAVNTFLQAADYYLVGQALARGDTQPHSPAPQALAPALLRFFLAE